jgi:hypothetical protein
MGFWNIADIYHKEILVSKKRGEKKIKLKRDATNRAFRGV